MTEKKILKVTIITVCKNSEMFLRETIESVINQSYKHIEFIIIDGDSSDQTVKIIEDNSERISKWVSEKDNGMYFGINKGLKLATGDYILILNSDDLLVNKNIIESVVEEISKDNADYYYGNLIKLKDNKNKKVKLFPVSFKELLLSTHGTFVPHPCFFISKELNEKLQGYNLSYKYASDYDYILRALSFPKSKGKYIDTYISKFRIHEHSITSSGKIDLERKIILEKHGFNNYGLLTRLYFYYTLWIKYKIINIRQGYKAY